MTGWELCKWLSELPAEQKNLPVYLPGGNYDLRPLELDECRVEMLENMDDDAVEGEEYVKGICLGDI